MKKNKLLSVALLLLGINASAQCPKYVLIEHFTQASCNTCPQLDTVFQKTIVDPNKNLLRQVVFHTAGPGIDTMYSHNPAEIDARTAYYSLTSIPWGILNGNKKNAVVGSYTQKDIDAAWAETSPVKIVVNQIDSADYRKVTVTVTTLGNVPAGSFRLLGAVIEKQITFATPPGSSSQTVFPNVFRRWLDSTAANGSAFALPAKGSSATRIYKFRKNAQWKLDEIEVVAYLQHATTKSILNVGSTTDTPLNVTLTAPAIRSKQGAAGSESAFNFSLGNSGINNETFIVTLTPKNAPAGWEAKLDIAGVSGSIKGSGSSLSLETTVGSIAKNSILNVKPDATSAFATYIIGVKSKNTPNAPEVFLEFNVISNVTDLVVNSTSPIGGVASNLENASKFEKIYTDALAATGVKTFTAAGDQLFIKGARDKALDGVKNIYFNAGWTFPVMGDDSLIAAFTKHLTSPKKRLFISGQDVGWETWDDANGASATPASQQFYTEFLNANWFADGSPESVGVFSEKSDPLFNNVKSSVIDTSVYGPGFTYPDEIDALGKGKVILNYYAADSSKKAGVRAEDPGKYKTVYLAIGLEQIKNEETRNAIIKIAYNWFNDAISNADYDAAMAKLTLGQNYPNPSQAFTYIPLGNVDKDVVLQLVDVTGRILFEQKIAKGSTSATVNTSALEAGIYLYRVVNGATVTTAKTMQVIR